jgi:hypothetical protein
MARKSAMRRRLDMEADRKEGEEMFAQQRAYLREQRIAQGLPPDDEERLRENREREEQRVAEWEAKWLKRKNPVGRPPGGYSGRTMSGRRETRVSTP